MFNYKRFRLKNNSTSTQSINKAFAIRRNTHDFLQTLQNKINFSINKAILVIVLLILALGLLYFLTIFFTGFNNPQTSIGDNRAQLPPAKATQNIEKEFSVPLRDQNGAEVSQLKLVLQNAELRDQIIVKAQKVTAISGRTFLILNLKITNEFNKTVQINTRDYFRLSVNKNQEELLAPEIHNDPVEVQASSIKYTKLAFAINDSDKDLELRIGELDKDKIIIGLSNLR